MTYNCSCITKIENIGTTANCTECDTQCKKRYQTSRNICEDNNKKNNDSLILPILLPIIILILFGLLYILLNRKTKTKTKKESPERSLRQMIQQGSVFRDS